MSQLVHEFSKTIRPFAADKFLLAVSGGRDSMALFYLFLHMREHFQVNFAAAHIHHGLGSAEQGQYRSRAQEFVANICSLFKVPFYSNRPEQAQSRGSENEWRQLRYAELDRVVHRGDFDWLVLAHHAQDQMETRLMRLIRGTGDQGLLGMKLVERNRLRPLLQFQPQDLEDYLREKNAQWLEDPSNFVPDKFRNWLRQSWLPELEKYRPGSLTSLARSLETLTSSQSPGLPPCIQGQNLQLNEFFPLSRGDKQRVLAVFLNQLGLKNYGMSHINEILKRLDSDQKSFTFQLLRRQWQVDAGHLKVL